MRSWLIPLIVFDLAFMPMFHFLGAPVKPSYVAIGFVFLAHLTAGTVFTKYLARELLLLCVLLIIVTLTGAAVLLLGYYGSDVNMSARSILIFLLAPMAFVVGASNSRPSHSYVIPLIFAYSAITIVFSFFYQQLGWIVSFYDLEKRVEEGLYAYRSQGLFQEANVSALSLTMLFLLFILGSKYGFVRTGPLSAGLVMVSVLSANVFLISRNQIIATFLLMVVFYGFVRKAWKYWIVGGLILASGVFLMISLESRGGLRISKEAYPALEQAWYYLRMVTESESATDNYLRPAQRLDPALARWSASPLIGTGLDVTGSEPFEGTYYHNDWLYILTSSGIIGVLVFATIVLVLGRLDVVLLIPFILPGAVNTLIFAPSHLLLLMLIAGIVWRRKILDREWVSGEKSVRCHVPTSGSLADAG